jgi:heavy metal sensor kinase
VNTRSLSFRLITWYAGLLTIVFVVLGALTIVFLRHYLEANLLDIQARRAHQIADTLLEGAPRAGDPAVARQVEMLYSPEDNDRFIRIVRSDGEVVYTSGPPKDKSFDPSRVPLPASYANGESVRKELWSGGALLVAAVPHGSFDHFRYVVEVGTSDMGTERTMRRLLTILAIGLPIAVSIAVTGGFVLVRRALKPVERIAQKAEDITQHNLSERVPVMHTGDELERLSISLNHMISRLEDSIQTSKQFVGDASHELRTPLTVLRGGLEAMAQDEQQLRTQTRETVGSMLEEVDRLIEIVEGLLALSRLDAGEANTEWVSFDLAELATLTADQMSLLAEDKNITVTCDSAGPVHVEGDRGRMKQLVVNLLDNAIKYTPSGGCVRLRITHEAGNAILEVADDGIGIPREALPHVFKRFYRVDASRSREQGGAGLGLSIVKSICAAHGAQVEVASVPGKGSLFRIKQALVNRTSAHALS